MEDSQEATVEYHVEASELPSAAELDPVPALTVSGVEIQPFLVMSSEIAAPTQPPTELSWVEAPTTRVLSLGTGFTPMNVYFAASETVDADGIPDVDAQTFAECLRDDDGRCVFNQEAERLTLTIPDDVEIGASAYLIVQIEWDVLSSSSEPQVHSILASYAVRLEGE